MKNFSELTKRQIQLIGYAADGFTSEQIAAVLAISPRTVSAHFANMQVRLGAVNRVEIIAKFLDPQGNKIELAKQGIRQ